MSTIQNLYEQAQLSEAAYSSFLDSAGNLLVNEIDIKAALIAGKLSDSQATDFLTRWSVVDQYTAPSALFGLVGTGFSATLFRNKDTGAYSFSMRGTEPGYADLLGADFGDIVMDGVAMDQLVDMYNYWQSLNHTGSYEAAKLEISLEETAALKLLAGPAYEAYELALKASGAIIDSTLAGVVVRRIVKGDSATLLAGTTLATGSGKLLAYTNLEVTGHSLGGHLAAAFTRLFPEAGADAITVNGAGFPTGLTPGLGGNALSNIQNLFAALGGVAAFDPSHIQNVQGDGPSMVSMNSQYGLVQPGSPPLEIYIESSTSFGTTFGHGSGQMTDSLAIYNLFATLDPSLNTTNPTEGISKITGILKASSSTKERSLENAIDVLRTLLDKNYVDRNTNAYVTPTETDKRDSLYRNLSMVQATVRDLPVTTFSIEPLVNMNAEDVVLRAQSDIAVRYALYKLNPFVVSGAPALYEAINSDGSLSLYDPATGQGQLTSEYLTDRAAMLAWKIKLNTEDYVASAGNPYHDAPNTYFRDATTGEEIFLGNPPDQQFGRRYAIFGSMQGETISGSVQGDRLYGMSGNDTINAGNGADRLEGGAGNDILDASSGNDELLGGAGDDTLIGGAGLDILEGGKGWDIYKADNQEVIKDQDRSGRIYLVSSDGSETLLTGGRQEEGETFWTSADERVRYAYAGTNLIATLVETGETATIDAFQNKTLGIYLDKKPPEDPNKPHPEAPPPYDPNMSRPPLGRGDPLALDLNHNGEIDTVSMAQSTAMFDITGDGIPERTGWIAQWDGFLVWDKNNDDRIQSDEVFGTLTQNGFEVLREQADANQDGAINASDTAFAQLKVWQDGDQDGIADNGELTTLAERQISDISLQYTPVNYDTNGNLLSAIGSYTQNGETRLIANIDLQFSPTIREVDPAVNLGLDSIATLDADIFNLPWLRGYGQMKSLHLAYRDDPDLKAFAQQIISEGRDAVYAKFDILIKKWSGLDDVQIAAHAPVTSPLSVMDKAWIMETAVNRELFKQAIELAYQGAGEVRLNETYVNQQYTLFRDRLVTLFTAQAFLADAMPGVWYSLLSNTLVVDDPAALATGLGNRVKNTSDFQEAAFVAKVLELLLQDGDQIDRESFRQASSGGRYAEAANDCGCCHERSAA